ncbi:SpoIIE family protein phosphatase [bacterium]|nr:SpoIIE family protein phosphatase [bacterium]
MRDNEFGPQPTPEDATARWLRRGALYVLAPLLLILEVPVAIHVAQAPTTGMAVHNLTVRTVDPGSPAARAGLEPGDRLLAIDGAPVATMVDYFVAIAGHYDLETQTYLLQRGDGFFTAPVTPGRPSRARIIWNYGMSLAGLAFLLMGWLILARRYDMVARYFFGVCATFAFFLMDVPDWPSYTYMILKETARDLAHLLLPAVFLRFFLYFPDRPHLTPRNLMRHRLLMLPAAPLFLLSIYAQSARLDPTSSLLVALVQQLSAVYFLVYMLAGLVVFARKVFRRGRPVEHTKLRLVLVGLLAGFGPFLAGIILFSASPPSAIAHSEWLGFSLVLVPLSFGLAILRYGALDLEYVVRHSLIYGILTILVVAFYALVVGVLGHTLTAYFHSSDLPIVLLAVMGPALALNPLRRLLHRWLDRTFYPAREATREALQRLSHELSDLSEGATAPDTMLRQLHALYRPTCIALYLEQDDHQILRGLHSEDGRPKPSVAKLSPDGTLCRVLMTAHRPIYAEELDGLDTMPATDDDTRSLLAELRVQLFVPLITGNRLRGLLAFGAKTDGSLYSQADVSNLHTFSVQAAALVEIGRLYQERLERKRLETEMSVAQRIQTNLVPSEPLYLPGSEVLGRMDSCREVGGDYFDYFRMDPRTVGFAIADVAGKGVPAALVMTTLRVAFRTAAVRQAEPEDVLGSLNQAICSLGPAAQLVSFFYGIYTAADGRLLYANAGMNPPLLFRTGRDYVERLKKGGTMLGVDRSQRFARGTLELAQGDLLLLYTDGLVEQPDETGSEFYGEERLIEDARIHRDLELTALIDRIFANVDAYGGPEQSDDRTLILMRINEIR